MRAVLVSIVLLSSGCLYGKLLDVYSSALGLQNQPAPASAPAQQAGPPAEVAQAEAPAEPPLEAPAEAPAEAPPVENVVAYAPPPPPPPPPQTVYAPTYVHSTSSTNVTNNVSSTTTYVNAAPPGPPAWIALYPAARGSSQTLCKRFYGTPNNHNACSVECNTQMRFGPGSCSCMDLDACPQGTRVVH